MIPAPDGRRLRQRHLRLLVAVLAVLAPTRVRRFLLVRVLGHRIHPTATIGRTLVDVEHLVLEERALVGGFNLIRNCTLVHLGPDAKLGSLNWVNGVREDHLFTGTPDRFPALVMGRAALVTMLHLIDACDAVELAPWAHVAGYWTLIQTHSADLDEVRLASWPVRIGDHAFVASRCTLLPGCSVPDAAVVGAGAVVTRELTGNHLFAGVPARPVRPFDPSAALFTRRTVDFE